MKKLSFVALAAAAIMFGSCGQKTPSAKLDGDKADSLAYAIGMAQSAGLKQAISQQGIDSTYLDEFYKGLLEGAAMKKDDKAMSAYQYGVQMGMVVSQQMVPGINSEIFGTDSTKTINLQNLVAALIMGTKGEKGVMTPEQAAPIAERLIKELKAEANKDVIAKSDAFVKKYAAGKDVKQIGKTGVYYKVLTEGKGEQPKAESTVKINYEGKNMAGKVFDSSYERKEPATMAIAQVVPGFQEALKAMPVGSKWEVCIPYDKAYGERPAGEDIPAYSALVFTIELLSIEKTPAQPQMPVQAMPAQ